MINQDSIACEDLKDVDLQALYKYVKESYGTVANLNLNCFITKTNKQTILQVSTNKKYFLVSYNAKFSASGYEPFVKCQLYFDIITETIVGVDYILFDENKKYKSIKRYLSKEEYSNYTKCQILK